MRKRRTAPRPRAAGATSSYQLPRPIFPRPPSVLKVARVHGDRRAGPPREDTTMTRLTVCAAGLLALCAAGRTAAQAGKGKPEDLGKALAAARDEGLDWLTKNQGKDGSWGKTYTIAVTSFACLCYLSAADEPYEGEPGKALLRGLNFLLASQKDGQWTAQGHSWIHGQGFATLALSE